MNSKRAIGIFGLLMSFVLLIAACVAPSAAPGTASTTTGTTGVTETTTTTGTTATGAAGAFKVGLVTDVGRVNDRSFNQSAWEGVQKFGAANGLKEGDD